MLKIQLIRRAIRTGIAAIVLAGLAIALSALGDGQSFTFLDAGYDQELVGVAAPASFIDSTNGILGGVAFHPDGHIWVAECEFNQTKLHLYRIHSTTLGADGSTSVRPELISLP